MYTPEHIRSKVSNEKFNKDTLLKSLVHTKNPVIIDAGANIGQSVDYFKSLWPLAIIHSFEPVLQSFNHLEDNTQHYNDVTLYNIALSNFQGTSKFNVNHHQIMLSSFFKLNKLSDDSIAVNRPEEGHHNFFNNTTETVLVDTLDNCLKDSNITKVDILKMDVQGAELLILEGASSILNNTDIIVSELNLYDLYETRFGFLEFEKLIIPYNFELYDISHISKNPLNGRTDWVEVIYRKSDLAKLQTER